MEKKITNLVSPTMKQQTSFWGLKSTKRSSTPQRKNTSNTFWNTKPMPKCKYRSGMPVDLFGDKDRDGVMNVFDCSPKNKRKQDMSSVIAGLTARANQMVAAVKSQFVPHSSPTPDKEKTLDVPQPDHHYPQAIPMQPIRVQPGIQPTYVKTLAQPTYVNTISGKGFPIAPQVQPAIQPRVYPNAGVIAQAARTGYQTGQAGQIVQAARSGYQTGQAGQIAKGISAQQFRSSGVQSSATPMGRREL